MNKKCLISAFVTCALLAACGGDKDQKQSTPIHSGDNSGSQTSKPANTFRVQAQYQDECGNTAPAVNAALIVHDAEFNTEQIINANANGVISYSH